MHVAKDLLLVDLTSMKVCRWIEMGVEHTFAISSEVVGVAWSKRQVQMLRVPPGPKPQGIRIKTAATNVYHRNWAVSSCLSWWMWLWFWFLILNSPRR